MSSGSEGPPAMTAEQRKDAIALWQTTAKNIRSFEPDRPDQPAHSWLASVCRSLSNCGYHRARDGPFMARAVLSLLSPTAQACFNHMVTDHPRAWKRFRKAFLTSFDLETKEDKRERLSRLTRPAAMSAATYCSLYEDLVEAYLGDAYTPAALSQEEPFGFFKQGLVDFDRTLATTVDAATSYRALKKQLLAMDRRLMRSARKRQGPQPSPGIHALGGASGGAPGSATNPVDVDAYRLGSFPKTTYVPPSVAPPVPKGILKQTRVNSPPPPPSAEEPPTLHINLLQALAANQQALAANQEAISEMRTEMKDWRKKRWPRGDNKAKTDGPSQPCHQLFRHVHSNQEHHCTELHYRNQCPYKRDNQWLFLGVVPKYIPRARTPPPPPSAAPSGDVMEPITSAIKEFSINFKEAAGAFTKVAEAVEKARARSPARVYFHTPPPPPYALPPAVTGQPYDLQSPYMTPQQYPSRYPPLPYSALPYGDARRQAPDAGNGGPAPHT